MTLIRLIVLLCFLPFAGGVVCCGLDCVCSGAPMKEKIKQWLKAFRWRHDRSYRTSRLSEMTAEITYRAIREDQLQMEWLDNNRHRFPPTLMREISGAPEGLVCVPTLEQSIEANKWVASQK